MSATVQDLFSRISQRGGVWLVIAAAHIAVVSAFTNWSPVRLNVTATPIEALILDMPPPESALPPPPVPQLAEAATPVIEPPLITLTEEPPPTPNAITVAVAENPPAPPPVAARVISDVAYVEPPQPRYPPESKRSGEEGVVVL